MVVCNLQHFRPLESPFALKVETANEYVILILLTLLTGLTDYVVDAETRNKIGLTYTGVSVTNIGLNLVIILGMSLNMTRKRILRWWHIRKAEQLKATQIQIWEETKVRKAKKEAD